MVIVLENGMKSYASNPYLFPTFSFFFSIILTRNHHYRNMFSRLLADVRRAHHQTCTPMRIALAEMTHLWWQVFKCITPAITKQNWKALMYCLWCCMAQINRIVLRFTSVSSLTPSVVESEKGQLWGAGFGIERTITNKQFKQGFQGKHVFNNNFQTTNQCTKRCTLQCTLYCMSFIAHCIE